MVKCSVCDEQVELRKENRYEVIVEANALQKSFGAKDHLWEAFDCPKCGCQMLMQERFPAKEEIEAEGMSPVEKSCNGSKDNRGLKSKTSKDEAPKFGDKVAITYGPEKRKADDITLDYLQEMDKNELLAFCGENEIRIPEAHCNERGYLISIIKKHCLV